MFCMYEINDVLVIFRYFDNVYLREILFCCMSMEVKKSNI